MFVFVLFCWATFHIYRALAQGECTDVRGRVISHGLHYVPGPDTCTLCICDNGQAKVCKAVLCSPPHDCRSFRVGSTCCEFICLDDVVKPAEGLDMNMRVTAGAAAAIVIMTVILVVYKVRKQKRRRPTHGDDQRSLTSIGYISGSMAYVGGTCETGLPAFKPPGNCVPRGEAPPPYEEVVAQSRAETMRISDPPYHRSYPTTVEQLARGEEPHLAPMSLAQCGGGLPVGPCNGHAYANLPRPITQMANTQNCYNAPLLQPQQPLPESREQHNPLPHHLLAPNMSVGYPSAIRLTGSLGAISNRGLLSLLQREPAGRERSHHAPGMYPLHTELHRTIPRISTAIDTTILDTSIGFNRADRSLQNEIRRSFHKPSDNTRHIFTDTGRSMPRNLNLASNAELSRAEPMVIESNPQGSRRSRAHSDDTVVGGIESKPLVRATNSTNSSNSSKSTQQPDQPMSGPQTTLPLTVDQPSCVCSYDGTHEHGAEDPEDYRSECENCKSASSSRWVLEEGWVEEASDGTQTLQRRAPPPAPPPPATATLPQPVTKQNRSLMGPPSNWENWFNTIPDSDTESEEE